MRIEPESGVIRVEGEVCIEQGILEYLAVARGGKAYESLVSLNCRPSHLQAALLIAGYQPGEVDPPVRGDFAPDGDPAAHPTPEGALQVTAPPSRYWSDSSREPTRVTLEVELQRADGAWERRPIESMLLDRSTRRPPSRLMWAFTGSFFHRDPSSGFEVFVADAEKSLIALWYDPTALLNLSQDVGNPYRGEDTGLEANPETLPARGTPIRLILRRLETGTE